MARPKSPAAVVTAYDLGYEHGRDDTGGGPPDWVNNADLLQAYDEGLRDGADGLDTGRPATDPPAGKASQPRRHRANPRAQTKTAATPPTGSRGGAPARAGGAKFSHPMHWGSGARGHTVGRPTLTPPRRLSVADGTGFAFGLVLYALTLSWIRYGPKGMTSWLSAKFVNRPLITADQAKTLAGKP